MSSPLQSPTTPMEVIQDIFALLDPKKVLPLKRLCHRINECLTDPHFAFLNLQRHLPHESTNRNEIFKPNKYDKLWFFLPPEYQQAYADFGVPKVEKVVWFQDGVSRPLPKALNRLKNVTSLSLQGNQIIGSLPDIGSLSKLVHLDINTKLVRGTLPHSLGLLTNLEELNIHGTLISGSIPVELNNLVKLRELKLHTNKFTGEIPDLSALKNLKILSLHDNALEGPIPASFSSFTSLQELKLEGNKLQQGIPPSIGCLKSLLHLDLSRNAFCGSIPSEIAELSQLHTLKLFSNKLDGGLMYLGKLVNLVELDLQNNSFQGNIPSSFGNLSHLIRFYISGNSMDMQLPEDMRRDTRVWQLLSWEGFH
ncbi:UNVERIFIED_CONTAM: hypothetical protein HDU68_011892 [Siphonaria sp. JEL0065]|nr:hypothetical protein HDU68_011892 [Siphonaria sp. JEL0065]